MSSVRVVTTLHKDGYNLYGKEYVSTWTKFFPRDWRITYYAESHEPMFDQRVEVLDFKKSCFEWNNFYDQVKQRIANIDQDKKTINRYKKALRWSFKMYTLLHAIRTSTEDFVIWMDADVYARSLPPSNWLESVIGSSCVAGQVERVKGFTHIETGILIVNLKHPDVSKLINWIEQGYPQFQILDEPKPWDGIWLGKLYNQRLIDFKNIEMLVYNNRSFGPTIAKAFSNVNLKWLVHNVGDDKFTETFSGRSGRENHSELI